MTTATRSRYRIPTASAYAEVSLDEFSREEIEGYLRHLKGESERPSHGLGEITFTSEELARLDTLALCGQREAAREWICEQVSKHIGRKL